MGNSLSDSKDLLISFIGNFACSSDSAAYVYIDSLNPLVCRSRFVFALQDDQLILRASKR